ncbi:MAG: DNA replication/repair protein RecF [Bacillota bacterium]|nr:DNA replication/repair protein RecF [Bacillota bacterium]
MYVKEIYLENFRNYKKQHVCFSKNLNILYGNNAQGKTNMLESIFLGAIGKSFKPVSEKEMIMFGEKFSDIRIDYFSSGRDMYNTVRLFSEKKKAVSVNGVELTKMSELLGKLTVVVFTPEELSLIKDGPFARRRFLDISISQIKPKYLHTLSSYNRVLEQKNKLLKEIKYTPSLEKTLSLWNEQLALYGSKIILYRIEFIKRIMETAAKIHREISKNKEELTVKYKTVDFSAENMSEKNIKEALTQLLEKNYDKEITFAQAVTGPHRDDLIFYINGNNSKVFGSQGQQRTTVLSLKLAQKELFLEETGEEPILLLDDITGELDLSRREYLFSKIKNSQVFITCTDTDRIENTKNAKYFNISDGKVCEK